LWYLLTANKNKHPKRPLITPAYVNSFDFSFFSDAKQQLNTIVSHLSSNLPLTQEHRTIEQYIHHEGHELLRRLLQAHLELRASQ
jgi:hypothetical protein